MADASIAQPASRSGCASCPSSHKCSALLHEHVEILGVRVSAVGMSRVLELVERCVSRRRPAYICVTGVHGVMEAQSDPDLMNILNNSVINTPDGMPMSWVGWLQGFKGMDRVYGPDLMLEVCRISADRGYRHFFYGGKEDVAPQLARNLCERFQGLQVVGTYTPPFRPLSAEEDKELIMKVQEAHPDFVWVGLSTPKQEKFMAAYSSRLGVPLMIGVGAAFDIHTGRVKDAPSWMKRTGLQWFHRLLQEPRRLSKRYLVNNPRFVLEVSRQLFGAR